MAMGDSCSYSRENIWERERLAPDVNSYHQTISFCITM